MYVLVHFLLLSLLKTRSLIENYECKSLKCLVKYLYGEVNCQDLRVNKRPLVKACLKKTLSFNIARNRNTAVSFQIS